MNGKTWIAVIGALVILGGLWALSGRIKDRPDHGVHNVQVRLDSPRRLYFRMEPVWMDITVTNHESFPLMDFEDYNLTGQYPYTFEGWDAQGRRLLMTEKGRQYAAWVAEDRIRHPISEPIYTDVRQGQSATQRIAISQYIDLSGADASPTTRWTPVTFVVHRYGAPSQKLTVNLIRRDYNLEDRDVWNALKSGKYEGDKLR